MNTAFGHGNQDICGFMLYATYDACTAPLASFENVSVETAAIFTKGWACVVPFREVSSFALYCMHVYLCYFHLLFLFN